MFALVIVAFVILLLVVFTASREPSEPIAATRPDARARETARQEAAKARLDAEVAAVVTICDSIVAATRARLHDEVIAAYESIPKAYKDLVSDGMAACYALAKCRLGDFDDGLEILTRLPSYSTRSESVRQLERNTGMPPFALSSFFAIKDRENTGIDASLVSYCIQLRACRYESILSSLSGIRRDEHLGSYTFRYIRALAKLCVGDRAGAYKDLVEVTKDKHDFLDTEVLLTLLGNRRTPTATRGLPKGIGDEELSQISLGIVRYMTRYQLGPTWPISAHDVAQWALKERSPLIPLDNVDELHCEMKNPAMAAVVHDLGNLIEEARSEGATIQISQEVQRCLRLADTDSAIFRNVVRQIESSFDFAFDHDTVYTIDGRGKHPVMQFNILDEFDPGYESIQQKRSRTIFAVLDPPNC